MLFEVVVDALPTATTSPLLNVVTPVRPSWLLPGFALVTGLQLVPFHCSAIVPKPVCSPFELEKPSPTAKKLLDAVPEMASKSLVVSPLEKAAWVQIVPSKFQMPMPPTTQTSVAEIASTATASCLFWSTLHVVPLNCRIDCEHLAAAADGKDVGARDGRDAGQRPVGVMGPGRRSSSFR